MRAVLLMAYGTPKTLDEVGEYYAHIRRWKRPSLEEIEELRRRYIAIGGRSPLLDITLRQAEALERRLMEVGEPLRVFVGMRHWHPFIGDVVREMYREGVREILALPLTPFCSDVSIGGYKDSLMQAVKDLGSELRVITPGSWHTNAELLETWRALIGAGLSTFKNPEGVFLLFTAHSVPERFIERGDPYKQQLLETSSALVGGLNVRGWDLAFQSASHTGERWLGPDILERLGELKADGIVDVLVAPIGFVSEHLEILYDIDVEAVGHARGLGMNLRRTRMPNDSPGFISALLSVVKRMMA